MYVYYTIILLIVCLLLLTYNYYQKKINVFEFQGFKVPKADFQKFLDVADGRTLKLCEIETKECIYLKQGN